MRRSTASPSARIERDRHERRVQPLLPVPEAARQLAFDVLHELVDFTLHAIHLATHVQDDFHAGEIHAQIARQRQDRLQFQQVLVRVEPRVAIRAGRLEQTFALVQPEGLRMDVVLQRHGADHVEAAAGRGACRAWSARRHSWQKTSAGRPRRLSRPNSRSSSRERVVERWRQHDLRASR